jgi:hypothetical protein
MSAVTTHLTFESRYGDPAGNPLGLTEDDIREAYRVVYAEWWVDERLPKVTDLEDEILTDFGSPIGAVAVMMASPESTTGKLVLLHGFARYIGAPGRSNPDRRCHFCYEGGVSGQDIVTVAVDRSQFDLTAYANVPRMLDRHHSLFVGDRAKATVGPFTEDEANVHTIRSRKAMFVPYKLVEVLLGQDLSAREAFLVSYPLLEDADLLEVCLPFLQYLQVASTAPTATEARPLSLQDRLGLDTPIRPAVINERRETFLYRLLPDLRPRTGPKLPDALTDNLGVGLTNIAAEMHADRQAREYRAGEAHCPKTFRERYGDRITDQLLLLANVPDDELLPPFYQELGGRQKGKSE